MGRIVRTDATNTDFINLVALLDKELASRDGDENAFYAQYNGLNVLKQCDLYYEDDIAVGYAALKPFDDYSMEIKRMYVATDFRGRGIASFLLTALEKWTKDLGYNSFVLETGLRQPEAVALYKKNKYQRIPNYPPYIEMTNSVCFKKIL